MSASTQSRVRDLLREAGPLHLDAIVDRLAPLASKNPKQTVRNALTNDSACFSTTDGRYCYLPTFVRGAATRVPMALIAPERRLLVAGVEVSALLWPGDTWGHRNHAISLSLADGPTIAIARPYSMGLVGLRHPFELPSPFWEWWARQGRSGADALLIRCEDGEAGRFTVNAIRGADLDAAAVLACNEQLRAATAQLLKHTRGLRGYEIGPRVLATGAYHGPVPPDALHRVLLQPTGPFFPDQGQVVYRPDITPAIGRIIAPRLEDERRFEEETMISLLEGREANLAEPALSPFPFLTEDDAADEDDDESLVLRAVPPARFGYRLKVSLDWDKRIWRAIEILDNQSLTDLHDAIQEAFRWGDDHLYAFFLSGKAWDRLTEVSCYRDDTTEPPTDDEVLIADLEPRKGQRLLYLFDFGDNLRHQIEVLDSFPAPTEGAFPRIVESHGAAPPQYPGLEEEWDEEL